MGSDFSDSASSFNVDRNEEVSLNDLDTSRVSLFSSEDEENTEKGGSEKYMIRKLKKYKTSKAFESLNDNNTEIELMGEYNFRQALLKDEDISALRTNEF